MPSLSLSTELVYGAMLGADCCAGLSSSAAPIVLPHADANVQAAMSALIVMILDSWYAIWMSSSAVPFAGICYSTPMAFGKWR